MHQGKNPGLVARAETQKVAVGGTHYESKRYEVVMALGSMGANLERFAIRRQAKYTLAGFSGQVRDSSEF